MNFLGFWMVVATKYAISDQKHNWVRASRLKEGLHIRVRNYVDWHQDRNTDTRQS